ncbi:tetratricopeptide repeat protein [Lysobacter koreensis]|uniref:Tetratricopeptide repeat protein n=1 Tax=Lysobacter koreensis TaxID=266122 RepID=A0ABW2YHQ7_9GAMM
MTGSTDAAGPAAASRYRFGDVVVDAAAHTLLRAGDPQTVEPKAFAVLLVLLQRAGDLVGRDDLLDAVWGHRHVTPGVLTRAIAQLRHALDDDFQHPRYIQTQHALGYRFIGVLETEPEATPVSAPAPVPAPVPIGNGDLESIGATPGGPVPGPGAAADEAAPRDTSSDSAATEGLATAASAAVAAPRPERRRVQRRRTWRWLSVALVLAAIAVAGWWWLERMRAPVRAQAPSIAVLPFTTLSADKADRYFAEGLAVELHSALAGVHGLKVAAWMPPSILDSASDAKFLGKRLGVATVLDASVRREGSRVRISARLADTGSGFTLWSRTYDRDVSDVFATQSEIAQEVVHSLVGVLPDAGEGLRKRLAPTRNVAAFDAYLRGLQQLSRGRDAKQDAIGYFNQALSHDKGFARAQAGICRVEIWRFEADKNPDAFDNARLACLRAGKMDPTIGEVSLALGDLNRVQGNLDKALEYYGKVEHDPAVRSSALVGLAKVHIAQGRQDLALKQFQRALEFSPGNANVRAEMGYQQYLGGHVDQAIESYRQAVELRPDHADYWSTYGGLLLTAGRNAEAANALQRSLAIEPDEEVLSNLGTLKYQAGDYAAAARLYRQAVQLNPGSFELWGNLGDALLADPETGDEARVVYLEAANRAQRYVQVKADDALALAALGWYRANLGDSATALELVKRSESLPTELAEVAYYNATTFAVLGNQVEARRRLDAARAAGVPEIRITTNAVFVRAGLVSRTAGAQ